MNIMSYIMLFFYYYYYFTHLIVFHTSACWWFSTELWITANIPKSPILFSVLLFPSHPVPVPVLWRLHWVHQLQLSLSCSIFFQFPNKVYILISLFAFFQFYPVVSWNNTHYLAGSLFLLIIIRFGRLAEIRISVCIWKSQRILSVSFSGTDSVLCIYHLFQFLAHFPGDHLTDFFAYYVIVSSLLSHY